MRRNLLQYRLLAQSIKEFGQVAEASITIDHLSGLNVIDGLETEVSYPLSWVGRSIRLVQQKRWKYVFMGSMGPGRDGILRAYESRADTSIDVTRYQLHPLLKGRFNKGYWEKLHQSEFTLCPGRTDWPGAKDRAWTYRFIEAALSFSIPITFAQTPLGAKFTDGFAFFDAEDFARHHWDSDAAIHNFHLAVNRHVLGTGLLHAILRQAN